MSEKDGIRPVKDDELDAVNGGITLKRDNGFFTGTYTCDCGHTDFKVLEIFEDGAKLRIECKKCGHRYWAAN